jgi:hypothetical protein
MSATAVGLHLSGSNAPRSAVVVFELEPQTPPTLIQVFDRIGSQGEVFSDERIVSILQHLPHLSAAVVDCPLSLPPCVACQLPACPGVVACPDISVAYMLAINRKLKSEGRRKKRPINPQSQRLWDLGRAFEPSYSANMAPLVVRARTLQRRLRAALASIELQETSVSHGMLALHDVLERDISEVQLYRSFEHGAEIREDWLRAMISREWIRVPVTEDRRRIRASVDVFNAFFAAVTAAWSLRSQTLMRPADYPDHESWVLTPDLSKEFP